MKSFDTYYASGIEADRAHIKSLLDHSLMLVTALVPHIGHERAAAIAKMRSRKRASRRNCCTWYSYRRRTSFMALSP